MEQQNYNKNLKMDGFFRNLVYVRIYTFQKEGRIFH